MIVNTSFHLGGTATVPTLVIGLLRPQCHPNDIHSGKSTHPTKSKIFWSCTSAIRRPSTSMPRHTTMASGWKGFEPGMCQYFSIISRVGIWLYLMSFTTCECGGVMHLVESVCLSVCPVRALTFESLDLGTLFFVCRYIFRISRSSSHIKVIRSRPRSQEQKSMSL